MEGTKKTIQYILNIIANKKHIETSFYYCQYSYAKITNKGASKMA